MLEVRAELEHAENPQHPDDPDNQQVLRIGVIQRNDPRHDRQQIHQPEKAEGITQGLGRTVQAQQVFNRENRGKTPLDSCQYARIIAVDSLDAVQHHDDQAGHDDQQQQAVEPAPGLGVGLEDDDVELFPPGLWRVHGCNVPF
ncbi:hypothetical protein D3C85_886230 [compost metagenome]